MAKQINLEVTEVKEEVTVKEKVALTKEQYIAEIGKFLSDKEWIWFPKSINFHGETKYSTGVLFNIIVKHNSRKMSPEDRIVLAKILKGIYIFSKKKTQERFTALEGAIKSLNRLDEDFKGRLLKALHI